MMARKHKPTYDMEQRLKVAHKSARRMASHAGRLLERIQKLEREVYARDLLIEQLKDQLVEAELAVGRAMNY